MSLNSYTLNPNSGSASATDTATSLAELASISNDAANGVVMIQVASSEAAGVEVMAIGSSVGILVANDGVAVPFYCDDLSKLLIKRQGGSNITFRFYSF